MKKLYREIIAKKYPQKQETFLLLERKLERGKNEIIPSYCILTPDERDLLNLLMEEIVIMHENEYGSLSYLIEKFGPYILVIAKEVLEKI